MSIKAKPGSSTPRELIPADLHIARCFSIIHVGTVKDTFKGEEKILDKVIIAWELPNHTKEFKEGEGEKPFIFSTKYTLSMYEKANLRKDVESWRGKGFTKEQAEDFDITVLIGQPCALNMIQKPKADGSGDTNQVSSIIPIPKAMQPCPPQVNKSFEFNYDDCFDLVWLEEQPGWLKDMIKSTPEYAERMEQLESSAHANKVESETQDKVTHDATQGSNEADLPSNTETPDDDLPF